MERESVLELIKKCLALSQSPNEHEAAAALAKAQELLLKHNIEMCEIKTDNQEPDTEREMLNEDVEFDHYQSWQGSLLHVLAKRNFCHTINLDRGGKIHILGRKSNVRVIVELYNWMEPQIMRLAASFHGHSKASYIMGMIVTIGKILDEQRGAFAEANPTSRALVLTIQSDSDRFFKECYPHTTKMRRSAVNASDYNRGCQDGHKVSVNGASHQCTGAPPLALGSGALPW